MLSRRSIVDLQGIFGRLPLLACFSVVSLRKETKTSINTGPGKDEEMQRMTTFGEKFRQQRKQRKVRVKELSKLFNCSTSLIYNIEKGINDPQTEFIIRASELFGVSTDFLLKNVEPRVVIGKDEELQLVKAYRSLTPVLRESYLRVLCDTATAAGNHVG